MPGERVLIIGGTRDGRLLAAAVMAAGFAPVTSMAGITKAPVLPPGRVHIGGFGGAEGLARYLSEAKIRAVIDAAHPFAVQISGNVAKAAAQTGVPHLHFDRPEWTPGPRSRMQPKRQRRSHRNRGCCSPSARAALMNSSAAGT